MATKRTDIKLTTVDDLFSTQEERQMDNREKIIEVQLSDLHPFKNHPFQVIKNDELKELAKSIKENGVVTPAIARPHPGGGYEMIAGHRRKVACEMVGLTTIPVIVRELDDDTATITMVDSNQQRENLLPSEKAFSYKMKLEAIKRQGRRTDLTSMQLAQKLSVEKIGEEHGESKDQIRRFIRLTYLIPEILKMVDEKHIAFNPAVELSYLQEEMQKSCLELWK